MILIPMLFSCLRIALTPLFVWLFWQGGQQLVFAIVVFTFAALTDVLDGYFARRYQAITFWGAFLDPIADKIFINTTLICFMFKGLIAPWMIGIILMRDVIVTILRVRAMWLGLVLKTTQIAKYKTVLQFVALYVAFIWLVAHQVYEIGYQDQMQWIVKALMYAMTASTMYTGINYCISYVRMREPSLFKLKNNLADLIATGGYIGYLPLMPGSFASLATTFVLFFLPPMSFSIQLVLIAVLIPLGLWAAHLVEQNLQQKDPSCIVIDEVIGMLIALIAVPQVWWMYFLVLGMFRFFDIFKPFPIRQSEDFFKGAWAVIIDDVLAGIIARCGWEFFGLLCIVLKRISC